MTSYIRTLITKRIAYRVKFVTIEDSLKQNISIQLEVSATAKSYRALWNSLKVSFQVNIKCDVLVKWLREPYPNKKNKICISETKLLLAHPCVWQVKIICFTYTWLC